MGECVLYKYIMHEGNLCAAITTKSGRQECYVLTYKCLYRNIELGQNVLSNKFAFGFDYSQVSGLDERPHNLSMGTHHHVIILCASEHQVPGDRLDATNPLK